MASILGTVEVLETSVRFEMIPVYFGVGLLGARVQAHRASYEVMKETT